MLLIFNSILKLLYYIFILTDVGYVDRFCLSPNECHYANI